MDVSKVEGVLKGAPLVEGVLKGAPLKVEGVLKGAPLVEGVLKGAPLKVEGVLKGAPLVEGVLKGAPLKVEGVLKGAPLGIIEKTEEVIENIDPTKYKLVKKPTEKQVAARLASGVRLKKIFAIKKLEKEKIMKEQETKLVADLKEKWKKEYDEEKPVVTTKNKNIAVPKNMIENKRKKRVVIRKPVKKVEGVLKGAPLSEDESSETEDDHIPETDTEAETTDTRIIKKKLAKVKQIEQVVGKQAINPYLSLLEKYYKK